MRAEELLTLAALARLCTWLLQVAGLFPLLGGGVLHVLRAAGCPQDICETLRRCAVEFWSCDLCLGFWVCLAVNTAWRAQRQVRAPGQRVLPFESTIGLTMALLATSGLMALGLHLVRLGWQAKWGVIIVGGGEGE